MSKYGQLSRAGSCQQKHVWTQRRSKKDCLSPVPCAGPSQNVPMTLPSESVLKAETALAEWLDSHRSAALPFSAHPI